MTKPVLYIRTGYALYLGPLHDNREHRHHLVQVALGLYHDFTLTIEGSEHKACEALLRAGVMHRVGSPDAPVCMVLFDADSSFAASVEKSLAGEVFKVFSEPMVSGKLRKVFNSEKSLPSGEELDGLVANLFGTESLNEQKKNPAMEELLEHLKSSEGKRCSAAEGAARIGLSESRMLHRFTEYTGIPFRRYLLWLRLRDAIDCITGGMNFTDAAHEAGFSDSAHLSRTFVDTFGMTMLKIFKNPDAGRFIQVIT